MRLAQYQRAMLNALFSDRPEAAAAALDGFLAPTQAAGLDIHRRNVVFGVVDQLRRSYPATERVLGEQNFKFLSRQYLLAHPPDDADMRTIGRDFGAYLAGRPEVAALGFLPDLARLEQIVAALHGSASPRRETLVSRFPVAAIYQRFVEDGLREPIEVPLSAEPIEIVVSGGTGGVRIDGAPTGQRDVIIGRST